MFELKPGRRASKRWLEAQNFGSKGIVLFILVAFYFANAKSRFSHDAAHMLLVASSKNTKTKKATTETAYVALLVINTALFTVGST